MNHETVLMYVVYILSVGQHVKGMYTLPHGACSTIAFRRGLGRDTGSTGIGEASDGPRRGQVKECMSEVVVVMGELPPTIFGEVNGN